MYPKFSCKITWESGIKLHASKRCSCPCTNLRGEKENLFFLEEIQLLNEIYFFRICKLLSRTLFHITSKNVSQVFLAHTHITEYCGLVLSLFRMYTSLRLSTLCMTSLLWLTILHKDLVVLRKTCTSANKILNLNLTSLYIRLAFSPPVYLLFFPFWLVLNSFSLISIFWLLLRVLFLCACLYFLYYKTHLASDFWTT